jgi:hypothetical protein
MASTNNKNADVAAMISDIYQTVMAELKAASLVCAAAEFTEFFNPVINREIPDGTNFASKTVKCKKCNHVANANEYEASNFTKACLYDSKPSGSIGYKKHAEAAYLSFLADCKQVDNEMEMIKLNVRGLTLKEQLEWKLNLRWRRNDNLRRSTYFKCRQMPPL